MLHIASQRFVSVMRSHSAVIHAVAHNPRRPELATTADDHTIRVWDLSTMAQLYEFTLSGFVSLSSLQKLVFFCVRVSACVCRIGFDGW